MGLDTVFKNAATTIFDVFKDISYTANYVQKRDDGFGTVTETTHEVTAILDSFAERDVQFLSFSRLIQPTDTKGMIKGEQLQFELSTKDELYIDDTDETYSIIAFSTDPAKAVWTLLLRRT